MLGKTIWILGLSSAGKTTLAKSLYNKTFNSKLELLDGDEIRNNLATVGFSKEDRFENIRRIRWLCNLLNRNCIDVIVSAITPYEEMRKINRKEINNYIEIWAQAPLNTCIKRDVKGLYRKALDGKIKNMTGLHDPFEKPENPDLVVPTYSLTIEESVDLINDYIELWQQEHI